MLVGGSMKDKVGLMNLEDLLHAAAVPDISYNRHYLYRFYSPG